MSIGNTITLAGNLTADPELRFTQSNTPVVGFTLATTERVFDRANGGWTDGDKLFVRCVVWKHVGAENVAASLTKGARVLLTGRLKQRAFTTRQGEQRTVIEIEVEEIAASLRYVSAQLTKAAPANKDATGQAPEWVRQATPTS